MRSRRASASASRYFPGLQSSLARLCTCDGWTPRAARSGRAIGEDVRSDRRHDDRVMPLCVDDTTCAANQACALIKDCGGGELLRGRRPRGPVPRTALCSPATATCAISATSTAMRRRRRRSPRCRDRQRDRRPRSGTSLTGTSPAATRRRGRRVKGALSLRASASPAIRRTRWRSCWSPTDSARVTASSARAARQAGFPRRSAMPIDIAGHLRARRGAASQATGGTPPVPTFVIGVPSARRADGRDQSR